MKVSRSSLIAVCMLLALPVVIHAQSGCSDSPEAPTDVLLLVGSFGMMYGSSLAIKIMRKRSK